MRSIQDGVFAVLITVERAMRYPDKERFVLEVSRVLKHGGTYLIADMSCPSRRRAGLLRWLEKPLEQHR